MKNTIFFRLYALFLCLFSSISLFAQTPNYAELVWKNVEAGEGIGARGLAIADLNLDGKKEIIATGWLGRSDHFFIYDYAAGAYKMRWDSRLYPTFIKGLVVTKIDGDDDPDIAVLSGYDFLEIYDGTTLAVMDSFRGVFGDVRSMAIGNIDSLPDKELVLIGSDSLRVFSLTTKKRKWAMAVQGGDVKIGDIDGDGRNEIFVGGLSWIRPGSSYVIDGYTKSIRWTITEATPYSKFDLFDVTGDGKFDLVGSDGSAIVYFNTTTRRAITLVSTFSSIDAFYIGDADGDGTFEILIGNYLSVACYNLNGSLRWSMRNSDGGSTNLAVGNIDDDASPEIIWGAGANSSGSDHLVIADYALKKTEHASIDFRYVHTVLLNDINFDQKTELIVAPLCTYGYDAPDAGDPVQHNESALIQVFNVTDHTLLRQTRYPYAVNTVEAIAIGSARFSTTKDIGVAFNTYPALFDYRLTTPIFESINLYNVSSMAFADMDGDGIDEWLLGYTSRLVAMKWSTNGRTFNPLWEIPITGGVQLLKIQNIDTDTAKEIILVSNGPIKVYNSITRQLKWETPDLGTTALDIVDMDRDNKVDLLIGTSRGEVIIYDIATQTIKKKNYTGGFTVRILRGGNIDADTFGRAEIIVGDSRLRILDGQTFEKKWEMPEHFLSDYGYSVEMGDVDGDNHVDLFLGNQNGVFQFRLRDTIFNRPIRTSQQDISVAQRTLIEQIYPNPTTDKLTVALNPQLNQPFSWRVYDTNGRLLMSENTPSVFSPFGTKTTPVLTIPVQDLPTGVYIFQIQTEKSVQTRRFVVANKF